MLILIWLVSCISCLALWCIVTELKENNTREEAKWTAQKEVSGYKEPGEEIPEEDEYPYPMMGTKVCTREANHIGPCNGYPRSDCPNIGSGNLATKQFQKEKIERELKQEQLRKF